MERYTPEDNKACLMEVIPRQHPIGEPKTFFVCVLKIATIRGLFRASQHFSYCSNYRPIGLSLLQLISNYPYLRPHQGLRL